MNVNQVLANTLSADAAIRQDAEAQLTQAAELDFSGYLTTIAQELANEQAEPQIRTAAGLVLKNSFSSRDFNRLREIQAKWIQQISPEVKTSLKAMALNTLTSTDSRAGQSAAQFITAIACIELPRNEWPELMGALVQNVNQGPDHLKQASLQTIGYICEAEDADVRDNLHRHSNAILTAVVQGARKEEQNADVRNAAINALGDSLDFVRQNFESEGERNYIMQVICEATQSNDQRVQQGAFGCLNRIMSLYYDKMRFYMEKALFGLTIMGMKSEEEDVAKLAIEFWCTVCEEEIAIEDENMQAAADGQDMKTLFNFARIAAREVVPVLLELLTKQDEDAGEDDYDVSRAAYQCLQLFAQAVGTEVVQPVLTFVEQNIRHDDWHNREAAVSAFGAIMDGPEPKMLEPLVKQAIPVLIGMMDDSNVQVRDSAAYSLGRICESVPTAIDPEVHLAPLIAALFNGLASSPKMAASCCWSLMGLSDRFAGEPNCETNALSKHFQDSVTHLLRVTERSDADSQLRTAAYEVLSTFVQDSANETVTLVANLLDVVLSRFEKTIPMQQQIVGVEDKLMLEEMQTSLASVLLAIINRLDLQIKPQADRIMQVCLSCLQTVGPKSSVPDAVFAAIGALASAIEEDFLKYMDTFKSFLFNALSNQEEPALCAMAIGIVSDIARSLGEGVQPFCDDFMNLLLNNLRSQTLSNQFKPAILQTFGDIAQAIGGSFETYVGVVAQVLHQAAGITTNGDTSFDMFEYVISLREGIMDAWSGIIIAFKTSGKASLLQQYVEIIFHLIRIVVREPARSEALMRSTMGVIGDLADAFPNGELAQFYRDEELMKMIKETKSSNEYTTRTRETARWAREAVKRQLSEHTTTMA